MCAIRMIADLLSVYKVLLRTCLLVRCGIYFTHTLVYVVVPKVLAIMTAPCRKRKVLSHLERMTLQKEVDEKKLRRCKMDENYSVSEATLSVVVKN